MKRGFGKTTQLIIKSAKSGNYIVCHTKDEAKRIKDQANRLGLNIPLPITYSEFLEKQYDGTYVNGFLIDNLELFLPYLTNVPINAITLNN